VASDVTSNVKSFCKPISFRPGIFSATPGAIKERGFYFEPRE
jgi:hypothetical protein